MDQRTLSKVSGELCFLLKIFISITESPDKHYMLDNKQLVIIPTGDLVVKISEFYETFYADSEPGEKPEPFENVGYLQLYG
jgi:hypothetical protein